MDMYDFLKLSDGECQELCELIVQDFDYIQSEPIRIKTIKQTFERIGNLAQKLKCLTINNIFY